MVNQLRREVGFWGAVGRLKLRDLASLETVLGTVGAVGGTVALMLLVPVATRQTIAGDFLNITGALLGVVFAGMALIVALMSESYVKLLAQSDSGITNFLGPFTLAIGLQISALITTVAYRAFAPLVPPDLEPWFFGLASVLFVNSCLEMIVLARNVSLHARLRAKFGRVTSLEESRLRREQGR